MATELTAVDALTREALHLSIDERVVLAQRILRSVESQAADPEIERAWEQEIDRRIEALDAGTMERVPADEVFARLREIDPA